MLQVELAASVRDQFGKGAMHRLRNDGKTPAVLYGPGSEPLALQLETARFYQELVYIQRRNAIVTLTLDNGETHHVLIKDVQTDPVRDSLLHADFYKIDIDKPRQFAVRVTFTGDSRGVDMGGRLIVEQRHVVLEGVPIDIPDTCELDITDLDIGDKLLMSALELPDNVTMVSDRDLVCVKVDVAARELEEEVEPDEEAPEDEAVEDTEASAEEE